MQLSKQRTQQPGPNYADWHHPALSFQATSTHISSLHEHVAARKISKIGPAMAWATGPASAGHEFTSWCLVLFVKRSVVCTVCVNGGYLHFICRQSNPLCQPGGEGWKFAMKICPGGGVFHIKSPGLPRLCQGEGHKIDRCMTKVCQRLDGLSINMEYELDHVGETRCFESNDSCINTHRADFP